MWYNTTKGVIKIAKKTVQDTKRVPQSVPLDERNTTITMEYGAERVSLHTNNATIMNRLADDGINYYAEQTKDGKIIARQYQLPLNNYRQFFKHNLHR